MSIVTIHQPSYWPWLGLLNKIAMAEKYVILDDVAANKSTNQYRNIFYCSGTAKYLTIPVDYQLGKPINELRIKNLNFTSDHLNKLVNYYLRAPFFRELFPHLEEFYNGYTSESAYSFVKRTMELSFKLLDINVDIIESSQLSVSGKKGDLVLNIVKSVGSRVYISGQGAKDYLDVDMLSKFEIAGIKIIWHEFQHPHYPQSPGKPFVEGLSVLDLLFWCGLEGSRKIFWNNLKALNA